MRLRVDTVARLSVIVLVGVVDAGEEAQCSSQVLSQYVGGWPRNLDFGVYWFGHQDASEKATADGGPSKYYDPSKKTVIYFHGWTHGWTEKCKRATMRCPDEVCRGSTHALLAERWLDDGWNVGIFYWDQFADEEDCRREAEQKIWFDRHGNGFRWRSFDLSTGHAEYKLYTEDANSLADICADSIGGSMAGFRGTQVRFVGHSIGAQLATRCAALLHERSHPAAPQRLALLEPFFSKHHLWIIRCKDISTGSGIGDFTADATAGYVRSLWDRYKVVTEIYKSSVLTEMKGFGVLNDKLDEVSTVVLHKPDYCGSFSLLGRLKAVEKSMDIVHRTCHHLAVFPIYFLSYGQQSPPVVPSQSVIGRAEAGSAMSTCTTPTAACTDGQIREWVERQIAVRLAGGHQRWTQDRGDRTISSSDDAYKLEPSLQDEAVGDPADTANLVVMRTAMSDEAIFKETHPVPWWRNIHNGHLQVLLVALLVACSGLACATALVCRGSTSAELSEGSDCEMMHPVSMSRGWKSSSSSLQLVHSSSGRERTLQLVNSNSP